METCSWCREQYENTMVSTSALAMEYEHETCSDLHGCDSWGYRVDNLCLSCGRKLKTKLIELGISVEDLFVIGDE